MLSSDTLNPLLNAAYTREITWLEASTRYSLDEFIETFYHTRQRMQEALEGMDNSQVTFASLVHPIWSVSESITHLIYSQGFYLNKLLDISTSTVIPHIIEAARGFGEGAKTSIPADQLRRRLAFATEQIKAAIEGTRRNHDVLRSEVNEFFGICTYNTWIVLLLAHEVDHLKQVIAMRRLARSERV